MTSATDLTDPSAGLCELCYMNPPVDLTEDGGVTFLPVPEALPNDDLCADCRQQSDEWARDMRRHLEDNHQSPWEHNCQMCSLDAYSEEQEKNWQAHLARCKECQESPPDSHVREAHRDLC